jgi:hypothetical protein
LTHHFKTGANFIRKGGDRSFKGEEEDTPLVVIAPSVKKHI